MSSTRTSCSVRPLVSVITPTYNHEQFVESCIHSVLQQTYSEWEQVVIDDGSTDNTPNIVSGFRDPRIRSQRQANQGPFKLAHTYNRALSSANGELIAILEGDDFWPPHKLATLIAAFLDDDVVLAYGEAADVDPNGVEQRKKSHTARLREGLPRSVLFNDPVGSGTRYMLLAEGRSLIGPSTVIIRRRALEEIGGFQYVEGLPLTDYPTFIALSLVGKFHYSAQIMGYRRRHLRSVTASFSQTIEQCVSNFALQFLEMHSDEIALTSLQLNEIQSSWLRSYSKLHFSEGRFHLARRQWVEAREHFRLAFGSEELLVRLAAAMGYASSLVHLDLELLMRLSGRADLRE